MKPLSARLCCGYHPTSCGCSDPAEAVKQGCLRGIYCQLSYGMQKDITASGQWSAQMLLPETRVILGELLWAGVQHRLDTGKKCAVAQV